MVAGRPSPAPLGPVYPAGSALGGGWGLLWPYRSRVFRWCLDAVERAHRFILAGAHVPGAVRQGTTYASAFQQANSLLAQAAAVNHLTARASFVPRRGGH